MQTTIKQGFEDFYEFVQFENRRMAGPKDELPGLEIQIGGEPIWVKVEVIQNGDELPRLLFKNGDEMYYSQFLTQNGGPTVLELTQAISTLSQGEPKYKDETPDTQPIAKNDSSISITEHSVIKSLNILISDKTIAPSFKGKVSPNTFLVHSKASSTISIYMSKSDMEKYHSDAIQLISADKEDLMLAVPIDHTIKDVEGKSFIKIDLEKVKSNGAVNNMNRNSESNGMVRFVFFQQRSIPFKIRSGDSSGWTLSSEMRRDKHFQRYVGGESIESAKVIFKRNTGVSGSKTKRDENNEKNTQNNERKRRKTK